MDSTGARAPIVNAGGTNVNSTMYVNPQGFMYKIHPLTGHLETGLAELRVIARYFENNDCTGRSWYAFDEYDYRAPMVTFSLRGGAYAFSRDVKVAYAAGKKELGLPEKLRSYIYYGTAVASQACSAGEITWPDTTVAWGDGTKHYFYYVDAVYVVAAPDPETLVKPTLPPYRFVPNI